MRTFKRQSIRLRDYDYSQPGAYFVTICTQDRQCFFGEIMEGEMRANDTGRLVEAIRKGLPNRFPFVELDEFVIMPNHVHGIILVPGTLFQDGTDKGAINRAPTLGEIMRAFKAVAARQICLSGISRFGWQRGYFDHIIRNEKELFETRQYIHENPLKWELDKENPRQCLISNEI